MAPDPVGRQPGDGTIELACHLNVLIAGLGDGELLPALAALGEHGCAAAVLPPVDPAAVDVEALRGRFHDHGIVPIPIAGQTVDADVSSRDPAVRQRGADALRAMVALTVRLGGDQLNGVPYGRFESPAGPVDDDRMLHAADEVGRVADEAADQGVLMTFEVLNRYETAAINTAAQAVAFATASRSSNLRVHLDSFHLRVEEPDPAEAVRSAAPWLGYLELGDAGRGAFASDAAHVRSVLAAALEAGYRGRVGVEAFSRSILPEAAANHLKIWRAPFDDGAALFAEAAQVIRSEAAASGVAVA
ncbi:epimerase [Pseudoclavibacter endophyticus]|uniref:Sugar phosphate isomerase/epimerase n=1 Tax=Pseudoclavibacter endophyticus TaxID=1778590 RepID=A0A6H9WGE3_9MICO|nr:sugar phosphate isomerase/epimerase family protein [Pseudoclavibacter endophyticus]KAB1648084.1 sugar phosphate isomerase/epimerase [Pseudoclavibacter endophyticus]GGA69559.1 epimerase [Pseudoclavibacter endophyticus]